MAATSPAQRFADFFAMRWRGDRALPRLFWFDMVLVGTAVNLVVGVIALALAANRAPPALSAAVFFSTLPYNLFLFGAVWRNAKESSYLRAGAAVWLVAATLL